MISKEVRIVADYLVEFYANPTTVAVFASSLSWAMFILKIQSRLIGNYII